MKMLGLISAIAMPFFNIPLIWRIIQRGTSDDISLTWAFGIWLCILGLLPASLQSTDVVLKVFGIGNTILFSCVLAVVLWYSSAFRKKS